MILNDKEIARLSEEGMITPFLDTSVRIHQEKRVISYGLSSFGYDIRLSSGELLIYKKKSLLVRILEFLKGNENSLAMCAKEFDPEDLKPVELVDGKHGRYFVLSPYSYSLGVSFERIKMPPDITALAIGKSTYARLGLIANLTPIEAGWEGFITLEFNNPTPNPIKLYANEGIVQLVFFRGSEPWMSYADKKGKYQDQGPLVTFPIA